MGPHDNIVTSEAQSIPQESSESGFITEESDQESGRASTEGRQSTERTVQVEGQVPQRSIISQELNEDQRTIAEENRVERSERNFLKMEQETFRIAELNEKNLTSWSVKLQAYLELLNLWDTVEKKAPEVKTDDWTKANKKALNLIKLRVSDKFIGIIAKCDVAHDAYIKLKEHFEGSGNSKMITLFDRFFQLKMNPPATVAELASECSVIMDEVLAMKVDDKEYYGYHFLHLLPDR